jgi:hypothetical protein
MMLYIKVVKQLIENSSLVVSLNVLVNIQLMYVYRDVIVELPYESLQNKLFIGELNIKLMKIRDFFL